MITAPCSIFTEDAPRRWLGHPLRSSEPEAPGPISAPPAGSGDAQLIAILDEPLAPGETALAGFQRKEHALGVAFAALSVLASRSLHVRLAACMAGDVLARKFGRLIIDRRHRLLRFLADARRREALGASRPAIGAAHE